MINSFFVITLDIVPVEYTPSAEKKFVFKENLIRGEKLHQLHAIYIVTCLILLPDCEALIGE